MLTEGSPLWGEILGSREAVLVEQLQFHVKAQYNPFRSPAAVHVGRVVTCEENDRSLGTKV